MDIPAIAREHWHESHERKESKQVVVKREVKNFLFGLLSSWTSAPGLTQNFLAVCSP